MKVAFLPFFCTAARMETFFYDKLEKWETTKRRDRETNCEALGQQMIDAGNAFGPGTSYGTPLTLCLFYTLYYQTRPDDFLNDRSCSYEVEFLTFSLRLCCFYEPHEG